MDHNEIISFCNEENEWCLKNVQTGKVRRLYSHGRLLVEDSEIDMEVIKATCKYGVYNAEAKVVRYADVHLYDGFKDGYGAISWMLYPDGMYFADSDGFGMEDNNEVIVIAIIDTNLDIIEPFRPIKSISRYLRDLREGIKPNVEISPFAHFKPMPYVEREYIYNVIIIDGSESMSYVREEVINVTNEVIQKIVDAQKENPDQNQMVFLKTFDQYDYIRDVFSGRTCGFSMESLQWRYRPSGLSPIQDSIYDILLSCADDFASPKSSVWREVIKIKKINVTIITDGYDNASSIYSKEDLDTYIDRLKSNGWDIIFHIIANEYHEETDWEQEMKEMFGPWWDMPEDCI